MTNRDSRLATKNSAKATNGLISNDNMNGDMTAPAISTIAPL